MTVLAHLSHHTRTRHHSVHGIRLAAAAAPSVTSIAVVGIPMFPPNLPAHAKLRPMSGHVADAKKWLHQGGAFAGKELLDASDPKRLSSPQAALEAARMYRGTGGPAELIEHATDRFLEETEGEPLEWPDRLAASPERRNRLARQPTARFWQPSTGSRNAYWSSSRGRIER
jgi:hypothetical protein